MLVFSAFLWSAIERFSIQGISFILSIIIARIVSPASYGLIVLIQVFISFSQIFIDGGFANALIQKKERTEDDYSTVFIFNMVIAVFFYFVFFFSAPYIANFYDEPQLNILTRVISLNLIFSSLSIVQRTRLTIELDFKTQTKAGLISVLISGLIGIIAAYKGLEVWALVIQSLVNQLFSSLMLAFFSRWKPSFVFSVPSFKRLFSFGSKLMLSNILTSLFINLANLLIGKRYTSADLAFYNRGFTLSQFPSVNISDVLNRIIYPLLTRVQDNRSVLVQEYLKYLHISHYIILPLMGVLLVLAEPLIIVMLTSKWIGVVPYLQLFCINFMLYPIIQQSGNPVAAIGKAGVLLKFQLIKRVVSFLILIYTLTISIKAICIGIIISSIFEAIVNIHICKKEIGVSLKEYMFSQFDVLLLSLVTILLVYVITSLCCNPIYKLIFGGMSFVLIYILGTYILNLKERQFFDQVLRFLYNKV